MSDEKVNGVICSDKEDLKLNDLQDELKRNSDDIVCNISETCNNLKGISEIQNASSDESFEHLNSIEWDGESLEKKIILMEEALSSDPIDLERLKSFARTNGGFVEDEIRKRAWPILMHMEPPVETEKPDLEALQKHKDYQQVVLDVNRTLKRFPPGIEEQHRYVLMDELTSLIVRILDKHPELYYYQGYHDVAITFLLVMGEHAGYKLVEQLSITHLYEFMKPNMDRTVYCLTYLYPILKRENKSLYDHLVGSEVGTVFCLPWLITWYAHTLPDYRDVVRLYDFLLASPYLMPMYIAAAIICFKEKDVLNGDRDMATQHFILSQSPKDLPLEEILVHALELYSKFPPDDIQEEVREMIQRNAEKEKQEAKSLAKRRVQSKPSLWNSLYNLSLPSKKTIFSIIAFAVLTTAVSIWYYSSTDNSFFISYRSLGFR